MLLIGYAGGNGGDRIDLSAIDAGISLARLLAFPALSAGAVYSGSFGAPATLFFDTTTHTLYGNVDAGSAADFAIQLTGVTSILDAVFVQERGWQKSRPRPCGLTPLWGSCVVASLARA